MPDWAKAKEEARPDPVLKQWIAETKRRLFGAT
jgi:hypothetical protein